LLDVDSKKDVRNNEDELNDLCPLADFCVVNYTKYENCWGLKNYGHCILYKEPIKFDRKYLKAEVIKRLDGQNIPE